MSNHPVEFIINYIDTNHSSHIVGSVSIVFNFLGTNRTGQSFYASSEEVSPGESAWLYQDANNVWNIYIGQQIGDQMVPPPLLRPDIKPQFVKDLPVDSTNLAWRGSAGFALTGIQIKFIENPPPQLQLALPTASQSAVARPLLTRQVSNTAVTQSSRTCTIHTASRFWSRLLKIIVTGDSDFYSSTLNYDMSAIDFTSAMFTRLVVNQEILRQWENTANRINIESEIISFALYFHIYSIGTSLIGPNGAKSLLVVIDKVYTHMVTFQPSSYELRGILGFHEIDNLLLERGGSASEECKITFRDAFKRIIKNLSKSLKDFKNKCSRDPVMYMVFYPTRTLSKKEHELNELLVRNNRLNLTWDSNFVDYVMKQGYYCARGFIWNPPESSGHANTMHYNPNDGKYYIKDTLPDSPTLVETTIREQIRQDNPVLIVGFPTSLLTPRPELLALPLPPPPTPPSPPPMRLLRQVSNTVVDQSALTCTINAATRMLSRYAKNLDTAVLPLDFLQTLNYDMRQMDETSDQFASIVVDLYARHYPIAVDKANQFKSEMLALAIYNFFYIFAEHRFGHRAPSVYEVIVYLKDLLSSPPITDDDKARLAEVLGYKKIHSMLENYERNTGMTITPEAKYGLYSGMEDLLNQLIILLRNVAKEIEGDVPLLMAYNGHLGAQGRFEPNAKELFAAEQAKLVPWDPQLFKFAMKNGYYAVRDFHWPQPGRAHATTMHWNPVDGKYYIKDTLRKYGEQYEALEEVDLVEMERRPEFAKTSLYILFPTSIYIDYQRYVEYQRNLREGGGAAKGLGGGTKAIHMRKTKRAKNKKGHYTKRR